MGSTGIRQAAVLKRSAHSWERVGSAFGKFGKLNFKRLFVLKTPYKTPTYGLVNEASCTDSSRSSHQIHVGEMPVLRASFTPLCFCFSLHQQ